MTGIAAAFTLARALKRAFLIEWYPFQDHDAAHVLRRAYIPLEDLFHTPCFEWDLYRSLPSIIQHERHKLDFTVDGNDEFENLFRGGINVWSEHKVIEVFSYYDFTPAVLLNPAFEKVATGFPRNILMSAKEPSMPTPSTLMMRYLFLPYLQKYTQNVTDEFERFKKDVRKNCADSTYYGLHLRLRSVFATRESTYFPCLGRLSAFTGQTCYFIASDSHSSSAEVLPHLPLNSRLLHLNLSRLRDSQEGILTGLLELFVLASSSMIFGFAHSTFITAAGSIKGSPVYWRDCATTESPGPKSLCGRRMVMRRGVGPSFDGVVDNAFDQRHRLGCVVREMYSKKMLMKYDALNLTSRAQRNPKAVKQLPVRACVVYVLTDMSQLDNFAKNSLPSLMKHLLIALGVLYPVVVFTYDISESEIESLLHRSYFKMLTLVDLGPMFPPLPAPVPLSTSQPLTRQQLLVLHVERYVHRLHSGLMLQHPALEEFDYYMRLESNTTLSFPAVLDPFRHMLNLGLNYAHSGSVTVPMASIAGLNELAKAYVRKNSVRPVNLHQYLLSNGHIQAVRYNTHLEIVRKEFFLHSPYYDFFLAVDKEMGRTSYTRGWTEGAIKHLGLAIFANPVSIRDFSAELPT